MSAIAAWTRRHRLSAFFALALVLSWWSWPFYAVGLAPVPFFACGPLLAALVVIGLADGWAGYRDLLSRLTRWRVGWTWWIVALGTPIAVLAVAALANVTFWDAPAPDLASMAWADIGLLFALRFVNPLDGPLGEEPGFRGYAVPLLQQRWSPLRSASTLGAFAALWHLPIIVVGELQPIAIVVTFAITFVYVWLFNHAGGSVLLVLAFHVAQGAVSYAALGFTGADADRMDWLTGALWVVIAIGLVTLDRRAWRNAPPAAIPSVSTERVSV